MAVVKMRKLTLVAPDAERSKIVSAFSNLGCIELAEIEDVKFANRITGGDCMAELAQKMEKLRECLEMLEFFLDEGESDTASVKTLKRMPEVKLEELLKAHDKEYDLLSSVADRCRELKVHVGIIDGESGKLENEIKELAPYVVVELPLCEIRDTKNTAMMLGTLQNLDAKLIKRIVDSVPEAEFSFTEFEKGHYVALASCLKKDKDSLTLKLAEFGFSRCPFSFDVTAASKLRSLKDLVKKLKSERAELIEEGIRLVERADEIKLLYDYYNIEYQKEVGSENIFKTKKTFILGAWLPADREQAVKDAEIGRAHV